MKEVELGLTYNDIKSGDLMIEPTKIGNFKWLVQNFFERSGTVYARTVYASDKDKFDKNARLGYRIPVSELRKPEEIKE